MPTLQLPSLLYSAAGTRELDRRAIEGGIAGERLMDRAGNAAFAVLRRNWPDARRILVLCGAGNNGGDGWVVARLAREAGLQPLVHALVPQERLSGDARTMAERACQEGVEVTSELPAPADFDLIVDAMLGTGISGAPREAFARAIEEVNAAEPPVLAIDIPSGLNADTGAAEGVVLQAEATVTFIGVKQGLLTGRGPGCAGRIYFDGLRVPASVYEQVPASCSRPDTAEAELPRRARDAHKGHFGHVLVMGGDHGFAGAAAMAAQAAARTGAGLVSVATRAEHCAPLLVRQPELMAHGIETPADMQALLERATVVVAGPGLGTSPWGSALLEAALDSGHPLVLDADALNLLAMRDRLPTLANAVLTPHPGEAARLLGTDTARIQQDRFAALAELVERTGATVLLKGAGTLAGSASLPRPALISFGNPGMASGGMGDVLSGIVAGLLAQGLAPDRAAVSAAVLHAVAADFCASENGERGLLATDLLAWIRTLINGKR